MSQFVPYFCLFHLSINRVSLSRGLIEISAS
jgi:hypothetical protein